MKSLPIINSFVSGEMSPKLSGRTDLTQYYQSAAEIRNMLVEPYGGAKKAPGTYYAAEVKDSSKATRLIPFIFSDTQAYIIEVGDLYMRFYKDNGQILSGAVAYEIVTTYTEAELFELQFAQTADTMYITHPDHAPAKLTRTGHTAWTLTTIDYSTGSARPAQQASQHASGHTITPSADTGAGITLTASQATFDALHVGSIWKIKTGWVKITGYTSNLIVTGNVLYGISLTTGPGATELWTEGAWSDYLGYPKCVTISEGRLLYGYTASQPQTVWGSTVDLYDNFELGAADDDAIEFTSDTNKVEVIEFLFPANEILVGTVSGVSALGTGSETTALTASTGRIKRKANYGAQRLHPKAIGNNVYYWQKFGRVLREYAYSLDADNYVVNDATVLSEHISESGIVDMDYQQYPANILWCVRDDGNLAVFTREIEQKVSAWTLHSTNGLYESVAVIPSTNHDQVWFIVNRTIDGATKRYVEYMMPPVFDEQEDMFFVHSGLSLDSPLTVTGATSANPVIIASALHGLSDGDYIKIRNVVGMTELNGRKFIVANSGLNTFELTDLDGNNIDGTAYTAYVSGGEVRKCVSTISGLDHLEGETVQVCADGMNHPACIVDTGAITLNETYSEIHVGLGYTARIKTNDLEGAPGKINAKGRIKRVIEAFVNIFESLGFTVGDGVNSSDDVVLRTSAMATDEYIPLVTDIVRVPFPSGSSRIKQVVIEQAEPLPLHVLSITLNMETH